MLTTPKMLTNTQLKMKFQQVLIHAPVFAKDRGKLCHTVRRLIHSLEFQAHTRYDPTGLYSSPLCPLRIFCGLSTVRKCWLTLLIYLTASKWNCIQPVNIVASASGLSNWDFINKWTVASILIASKCQMCTWRLAANPKGAIFLPSVLLFVYLYWLSCPHLFVSRSDIVPTCHCLHSWGKPGVKKHLTFPLNVLGLQLSPAGVAGRSRHPPSHAGSEHQGRGRTTGDPPRWQALKSGSWTGASTQKWACREEWGCLEVVPAGRAGSHRLHAVALQETCNSISHFGSDRLGV